MLVLTRKRDEVIEITVPPSTEARTIKLVVLDHCKWKARLGFEADDDVLILREELAEKIAAEGVNEIAERLAEKGESLGHSLPAVVVDSPLTT